MSLKKSWKETCRESIKQWTWYRDNPSANKHDYFLTNELPERPAKDCYLCDYFGQPQSALEGCDPFACRGCPLCIVGDPCYLFGGIFYLWRETDDSSPLRSYYAAIIRDLVPDPDAPGFVDLDEKATDEEKKEPEPKDYTVYVGTEAQRDEVLNEAFRKGYMWAAGDKAYLPPYEKYWLYFHSDGDITCGRNGVYGRTELTPHQVFTELPELKRKKKKVKVERWLNMYTFSHEFFWKTEKQAEDASGQGRIRCVHLTGEYEE